MIRDWGPGLEVHLADSIELIVCQHGCAKTTALIED
jgi:hypothetical protein